MIIIGIKRNGERLRFERWLYEAYIRGQVSDPMLASALNSCVRFHEEGAAIKQLQNPNSEATDL